jgi:hypothetical protein
MRLPIVAFASLPALLIACSSGPAVRPAPSILDVIDTQQQLQEPEYIAGQQRCPPAKIAVCISATRASSALQCTCVSEFEVRGAMSGSPLR